MLVMELENFIDMIDNEVDLSQNQVIEIINILEKVDKSGYSGIEFSRYFDYFIPYMYKAPWSHLKIFLDIILRYGRPMHDFNYVIKEITPLEKRAIVANYMLAKWLNIDEIGSILSYIKNYTNIDKEAMENFEKVLCKFLEILEKNYPNFII